MISPAQIRRAAIVALILALPLLAGCKCRKCDYEMERVISENGPPDQVEPAATGNTNTETWIYREGGYSVVFIWLNSDCSCDVRTHYDLEGSGETDLVTDGSTEFNFRLAPRIDRPLSP